MSPSAPATTGMKTSRLILISGSLLAIMLVAGCALGLWALRQQTLEDNRANLERLALALAEQTERSFQGIDLVIKQARSELDRLGGTAAATQEALHIMLGSKIFGLPQGQALLVFGADGTMVAHSREFPTPAVKVPDRDYFVVQKNATGDALYVSSPMRNRVNNRWMVSLSRRLESSRAGQFDGVVMAAVEVEYFARLYYALHLPEGVSIVLQRFDGTVLVGYPRSEMEGSLSPLGAIDPGSPGGNGRLAERFLNEAAPTLVAVHTIPALRLAVGLALPEAVAIRPWQKLAAGIGLGTGAAVAAIMALMILLSIQVVRLEQREAARARLAAIVESSGDAIVGQTLDGRISSWNRGAEVIYGYTATEAIGRPVAMLAPEERQREIAELAARVLAGEDIAHYETIRRHKDGRGLDVAITASPIRDARGVVVGTSTIARDITEARRAQEEIRRYRDHLESLVGQRTAALTESNRQLAVAKENAEAASHAKSSFLANMSHEIRTPMNAILGFTQIMQRSSTLESRDRENLEVIQRSGRNLLALINDVLEMSKIEAGRTDFMPRTFNLRDLLDDLYLMFRVPTDAKGLHWELALAADLPAYIVTDEGKLRQILINLVGNAVKFTESGGVVLRTRVTPEDGCRQLVIEVEDTGTGIADSERHRLFTAFQQTTSGLEKGGTGLGLTISRRFAQLMGGDLSATSVPGKGSVFRLEIPVEPGSAEDVRIVPASRRAIGLKPGQGEVRILICDDKADNRLFLRRLLEPLGFVLREETNGLQAIEACEAWRPHLILMDIVMPAMDGHEATRRIKAMPFGRQVKIVALSASAFDEDRDAVLATGADDFVRKPVTGEDLLAVIASHLGIEYDFDEMVPASATAPADRTIGYRLPSEPLDRIPADLFEAMRRAVFRSDDVEMKTLIGRLPPDQGELGNAMRRLVNRFDWDALDTWLGTRNDK